MRRARRTRRSGAILIVALVAVAIFTSLAATNIRSVLRHRQGVKSERDLIQTQLLCDAGCDRAVTQFTEDPSYSGELWLDKQDPSSGVGMKVAIEILRQDGKVIAGIQASMDGRGHQPSRIQRTRRIVLSENP